MIQNIGPQHGLIEDRVSEDWNRCSTLASQRRNVLVWEVKPVAGDGLHTLVSSPGDQPLSPGTGVKQIHDQFYH